MKVLTTTGLTKLIQLIKSSFISVDDTVTTNTVTLATVATTGAYSDLTGTPTIGNGTITFTQGGTTKGTITLNQSNDTTIALDAGGSGSGGTEIYEDSLAPDYLPSVIIGDGLALDYSEVYTNWTNPRMYSASQDGYVVTSNYSNSDSGAANWKAFDKDTTTSENCWWSGGYPTTPVWIQLEVPTAVIPTKCTIYNELATPANFKDAILQGSNDGINYDNLYYITNSPNTAGYSQTCNIDTNNSYKYLRISFTSYWTIGVSIQEIIWEGKIPSGLTNTPSLKVDINYVTTDTAQTITGAKTFNSSICCDHILSTGNNNILQFGTDITIGNTGKDLYLFGNATRPIYKNGNGNNTNLALYSDIPTVPTNISAFTNDSGYITGITSSDVTTALGYTPVNKAGDTMTGGLTLSTNDTDNSSININNVSSTQRDITFNAATHRTAVIRSTSSDNKCTLLLGVSDINNSSPYGIGITRTTSGTTCTFPNTTCVDGQWTISTLTIVNSSTTITAGQTLSYKLNTYLPNDNYKYEVMYSAYGETTNTSGAVANIGIGSDVIGADNNCITVQRTRTSSTMNWGVSGIMIINNDSNRYIKIMQRDGNNNCTLSNFRVVAYRRIGTNS